MSKVVRKILNILIDVILILILLISVVVITLSLTSKSSGVPNLFGYAPLSVASDSMEPEFSEGDLVISKVVGDNEKYKVGDIVSFHQDIDGDGNDEINTHRIIKVEENETGLIQLITTKGDNAPDADVKVKTQADIIAKYTGTKIGGMGNVLSFLRTQTGFFFCILLPMIIFFVYEIIRVVMNLMAYSKEKAKEAAAETVANSELTEEQKQRAIEEYLAQQKEQAEIAPPQDSESEVQTPAADEATAPDDTAATAESPETAQDADPDETI